MLSQGNQHQSIKKHAQTQHPKQTSGWGVIVALLVFYEVPFLVEK